MLRRCVWSRNINNGCSIYIYIYIYIYDISRLRVKLYPTSDSCRGTSGSLGTLLCNENLFVCGGVNNTLNLRLWSAVNYHCTMEKQIQHTFYVTLLWCVLRHPLIGLFTSKDLLTGDIRLQFLCNEVPRILRGTFESKTGPLIAT